jgi:hypothetical protein
MLAEQRYLVSKGLVSEAGHSHNGMKPFMDVNEDGTFTESGSPQVAQEKDRPRVAPHKVGPPNVAQEKDRPRVAPKQNPQPVDEAGEFAIDQTYTHFAVDKSTGKIVNGWEYSSDTDKESIMEYCKIDLLDMYPERKVSEFKVLTTNGMKKQGVDPFDTDNWYKTVGESFDGMRPPKPIVKPEPNKRRDIPVSPSERKTSPPKVKPEPNPTNEAALTEGAIDPNMVLGMIEVAGDWINAGGVTSVGGESVPTNLANLIMGLMPTAAATGFIAQYWDEIKTKLTSGGRKSDIKNR